MKDAQEYVANVALEDLRRRLDSVDSAALPITNDETLIINRVAEVIEIRIAHYSRFSFCSLFST